MIVDMTEASIWAIGAWRFDPVLGTLSSGMDIRHLEHRAAAVLAMLARRRGEVVSRQELLDEVWHGRTVSPNSVAIVVGDLRRALDDDPKSPALLLTVAKRGYRLAPSPRPQKKFRRAQPVAVSYRRMTMAEIAGMVVLFAVAVAGVTWLRNRPDHRDIVRLVVGPVSNQTGLAEDAPLASALDGLLLNQLMQTPRVAVERPQTSQGTFSRTGTLLLNSKLVLWNRLPTLEMNLVDQASHRVIWSDMAIGNSDHIAAATIARLTDLRRRLVSQPNPRQSRRSAG